MLSVCQHFAQEEDRRLDAAAPGHDVRQGGGGEGAAEGGGRPNAEGRAARLGHSQCGADGEETGVSTLTSVLTRTFFFFILPR